jgi:hypothetical protein
MEKRTENKLIMLKATLSLLEQNQPVWHEISPLAAAINQTKNLLEQTDQLKRITGQSNSGLVAAKEALQENLVTATFGLSSAMAAFAAQTNDPVLLAKVDFPVSKLRNMRDSELAIACSAVVALALELETALAGYGVPAAQLNNLGALVNQYQQSLPNHRVTVSERKAATEKIKKLATEAMLVTTKQTDRLMVKFKTSHPDFYAAYLNARKIVDYGTRYDKPGEGGSPGGPVPPQ